MAIKMIQLTKLEEFTEALVKEIEQEIAEKDCEKCEVKRECPSHTDCTLRRAFEEFFKPIIELR